jgi:hypothetical protein
MNRGYLEEAKKIALMIFAEYLKKGAPYEVQLEDHVKCAIYQRYGCFFNEDDSHQERRQTIHEKTNQIPRNKSHLVEAGLPKIKETFMED